MLIWDKGGAIRKQGKGRFILVYGGIGFGISTSLFWAFSIWALSQGELLELVWRALLFFPLLGLLWGWVMWRNVERKYSADRGNGGR